MIADKNQIVDGQYYKQGQEIWDLGSLVCIDVEVSGNKRHYQGLSADVGKLPHYVTSGSTCFMLDTSELYRYHALTDTWYKLA